MGYTNKSPLEPTMQQRQRIIEIMRLFPDIRYQIGGTNPSFEQTLISGDSVVVFVHRDFFDKYDPLDIIRNANRAGQLPWLNRDHMTFACGLGHVYLCDDDKGCAEFVRVYRGL